MMILQSLVGVELPIIQAPMAGAQGSALAVAVCNAGGLGSLPCAMLSPDALRKELAAIRAQTVKPFNVNFFCHDAAESQCRARGGLASDARSLLRGVRSRHEHDRPRGLGGRPSASRLPTCSTSSGPPW